MNSVDFITYNLNRIMTEKNVSMRNIETNTSLSYGLLSKYKRGIMIPTAYTLCNIAEYLDVDVREFFRPINCEKYEIYVDADKTNARDVLDLFYNMSEPMQKAIVEIMKVTQEER